MKEYRCKECGEWLISYNIRELCDSCNHAAGRYNAKFNNEFVRSSRGYKCTHNYYDSDSCTHCGERRRGQGSV